MQPSTLSLWLTVIVIGLITFGYRLSFLLFASRLNIPPRLQKALRFVPAAALSALILPDLVLSNTSIDLSPSNFRLIAGMIAAGVAWRTKNVLLTIGVGMAALWILQWVLG